MDKSMNAVVIRRYGPPEVLEQSEVPVPKLEPNGVLVKVVAAGVNPADWNFRSGRFRAFTKLPFVPGADVAGIVEAVGPQVQRFKSGDAVFAMLPTNAGGGYASYAAVNEYNLAMMPPNLSFAEAAAVPLAALTALQALRDKAQIFPNARVLIYGASGGVGSFAVQIAKALGAHVAGVASGRNSDFVRGLGADDVIDYTQRDITNGGEQYDVIFDAIDAHSFRAWRRVLRPNGVVVTVNPLKGQLSPSWLARFRGGRRLKSIFVKPSGADLYTLNDWIASGQVRPFVEQCFPLAEAAAAHTRSETKRVRGKLVLVVDEV